MRHDETPVGRQPRPGPDHGQEADGERGRRPGAHGGVGGGGGGGAGDGRVLACGSVREEKRCQRRRDDGMPPVCGSGTHAPKTRLPPAVVVLSGSASMQGPRAAAQAAVTPAVAR